ncbi:membrane protein [Beggiatoa sp. PS]|nr:membrane protein [Beggiatoa sp. PS]
MNKIHPILFKLLIVKLLYLIISLHIKLENAIIHCCEKTTKAKQNAKNIHGYFLVVIDLFAISSLDWQRQLSRI